MAILWKLTLKQKKTIHCKARKLLVEGSAGSGKTIYAVHKVILYALEHPNARLAVFRGTLPALKVTAWLEIREALYNYDIYFQENKSDNIITFLNGSTIQFKGLDDLKKIRSLNLDFIWIEQAEEIDLPVYRELEKRLRGKASKKDYGQLILTVTPEDKNHWIYDEYHREHAGKILHFHYTDNPFLPDEYVAEYEDLKEKDYELYVKYTLGEWGNLSFLIYENWDEKVLTRGTQKWLAGVDFGFSSPSCFLLIGWYDDEPYIVKEVYQDRLTNREFIIQIKKAISEVGLTPGDIGTVYCDNAEPDRIEEFNQEGFNAIGGKKDVTARIETVRSTFVHISPECVNSKREIKGYKYQRDKNNHPTEKPVPFNDHAMDALGYCLYGALGHLSPFKMKDEIVDIEVW